MDRLSLRVLRNRLRALSRVEAHQNKKRRRRSGSGSFDPAFLPQNSELEVAIAHCVHDKQDARSMLNFTRHLMNSTLMSLGSPVGQWDPYDAKPQVFALNTFIALPVFTSLRYMNAFCEKFQFMVRDPSGNLWSDGSSSQALITASSQESCKSSPTDAFSSFDVMDALNDAAPQPSCDAAQPKRRKKRKTVHANISTDPLENFSKEFLTTIKNSSTFDISKATPLPLFGPLTRPYFVGYFADVETLLRNASIVPDKVDIIVNPCSCLEIALAREATDRVMSRDQLILLAYTQLEKELRSEFYRFFSECPEVLNASSACVAKSHSSELHHNYIDYQIVVVVETADYDATWRAMSLAKHSGRLRGHPSLDVLLDCDAAPHVKGCATIFYQRHTLEVKRHRRHGLLQPAGAPKVLSVGVDTGTFFVDPTNLHTEAETTFTEQLKFK